MENTTELIEQIPARSLQPNTFNAIAFANRGWAVFPLAPETKLPIKGSHAIHDATNDHDALNESFTDPELNVGIRTGDASRLVVVDIDCHVGGANGHDSLAALEQQGLILPLGNHKRGCGIVTTPTGGMHLYYTLDEETKLKNTAGVLAPGIDTRADGGYVVAPPSRTPAGSYRWKQYPVEMFAAPRWLIEKTLAETYQPKKEHRYAKPSDEMSPKVREMLSDRLNKISHATSGQRNHTLNREAFYLAQFAGKGFSMEDLDSWLLDAAMQSNMPAYEARRTIDSALKSQMHRLPSRELVTTPNTAPDPTPGRGRGLR